MWLSSVLMRSWGVRNAAARGNIFAWLHSIYCIFVVSWVAHEGSQFTENMYILEEGEYPSTEAMGFLSSDSSFRSIRTAGHVSVCSPWTYLQPSVVLCVNSTLCSPPPGVLSAVHRPVHEGGLQRSQGGADARSCEPASGRPGRSHTLPGGGRRNVSDRDERLSLCWFKNVTDTCHRYQGFICSRFWFRMDLSGVSAHLVIEA